MMTSAAAPLAPLKGLGRGPLALVVATLMGGLLVDAHADIVGQMALSGFVWLLLLALLRRVEPHLRWTLMACMVLATAGELFLSLVWGLYTYRLDNIPLFVPPGHVFLLMLGLALAQRMPGWFARLCIGLAGVYALVMAALQVDTLGVGLFLLLLAASLALPAQRRLYASTLLIALALELYGTALGNWAWAREVPGTGLVTTNPPWLAGAFYCALDGLVAATSHWLVPALAARAARRPVTEKATAS